jgi:hypothetical protein
MKVRLMSLAKVRLMSLALTAVLVPALVLVPLGAKADAQTSRVKSNVKGAPAAGTLGPGGTFKGDVKINALMVQENGVFVVGTLSGTATSSTGAATPFENQSFTAPLLSVQAGPASGQAAEPGVCDILFLDLGPIFLNLLGLTVDLSEVILDIDAVPGEDNLLGNLLCALINLLTPDNP